mgnify:CR=1 FL=1
MRILAIDPGNIRSGYVLAECDEAEIRRVLRVGKVENAEMMQIVSEAAESAETDFVIEMIAGMGMAVGAEVFDTCVWIGRFWERALIRDFRRMEYIYGSPRAKDGNIRQALADRYAPGKPNYGKGTKKEPGFFFGFSADMWAAMAVAVTYYDKYIKGIRI